jgi:hypothetical protein
MLFTYSYIILSFLSFFLTVHGAPTVFQLRPRQLSNVAHMIESLISGSTANGDASKQILAQLSQVQPTTRPTSVPRKKRNPSEI